MPLVLPALVLSIALTVLFSNIGFTAGSTRLVVAHLVLCVPYVVRVTLPVLQRIDPGWRRPRKISARRRSRHSSS